MVVPRKIYAPFVGMYRGVVVVAETRRDETRRDAMRQRAALKPQVSTQIRQQVARLGCFWNKLCQQGGSYHVPKRRCQQTRGGVHAVKTGSLRRALLSVRQQTLSATILTTKSAALHPKNFHHERVDHKKKLYRWSGFSIM